MLSAVALSAAIAPVIAQDTTPAAAPAAAAMLPARRIDCVLGRITNFDPSKNQAPSDYRYTGRHPFSVFLPSIPVRTTAPPRSTQRAEAVNPQTRVRADPDGLFGAPGPHPFNRVVDYWPDRVEMTAPAGGAAVNLIILDGFDARSQTVHFFMTKAQDAVTYDLGHLYSGICTVDTGPMAAR